MLTSLALRSDCSAGVTQGVTKKEKEKEGKILSAEFLFFFSQLDPVHTGTPPLGIGGGDVGVTCLSSIWEPGYGTRI